MLTNSQIAVAVVVVAVMTFVCRIVPFVLLRGRQDSALLAFLSRAMPLGVMIVLVAYTLGGVSLSPSSWLPAATGIGVPQADLPAVWSELARAGNARGLPGSGLGLALVSPVVRRHGGSVRMASREGVGTRVWLSLPVAGPADTPRPHGAPAAPAGIRERWLQSSLRQKAVRRMKKSVRSAWGALSLHRGPEALR